MSDPPRLKTETPSAFARALLESALDDRSAEGAAARAIAAVGIGAIVASASASSAAGTLTVSSKWGGLLIVKWLGIGLFGGLTSLLAVDYVSRTTQATRPIPAPVAISGIREAQTRLAPPAPAPVPLPTPPEEYSPHPVAIPPSLREPSQPEAEQRSDPLRDLQAVRNAIAVRAPERALALLDDFERRYADSSLSEEAAVLRIEAAADQGRSDARALGVDFLRRYPHSAYGRRVRSKLSLP